MAAVSQRTVESLESGGGRVERWTVDEVLEGQVRLLVCEPLDPAVAQRIGAALAIAGADEPAALQSVAMELELANDDALWSDEIDRYVPVGALMARLRSRHGKTLPRARDVREGDVFLVAIADVPSRWRSDADRPGWWLPDSRDRGVVVLDFTAAARQATKVRYESVLATGAPAPLEG
jgi:hypothetical protein